MWEIKKEPERERIVVTVSGDEIIEILPDGLLQLINRKEEEDMEGEFKREMYNFEKGTFKFYLPIKTTTEGTDIVDNTLDHVVISKIMFDVKNYKQV
jgi:hypothetical protein